MESETDFWTSIVTNLDASVTESQTNSIAQYRLWISAVSAILELSAVLERKLPASVLQSVMSQSSC